MTHGDLAPLCRDLPETTTPAPARPPGPYGAALLAISVAAAQFRHGRGPDGPPPLPPGGQS